MQIRSLETELRVTLFNRTQRSVALTQSGNALLGEARHILARLEQAVLMARRASRGEIGKLAIRFISVADYNVLPVVLREFRRAFPLVNLTLRESTTDAQLRDLLAGRIEVGCVQPPINQPSLESLPILRDPLLVALPDEHPLARKNGKLALEKLEDAPFILFPRPYAKGLQGGEFQPTCRRFGSSSMSPRPQPTCREKRG